MYLGGDQGQTHALQVAPLLTEDKVLLLGFRNDELELDLLAQHGGAEGESVEGALRQLKARTHTRALVTQRVYQATQVKSVKDFQDFKHINRYGRMCMLKLNCAHLCSRPCLTVMLTLFTVMKGIVGREPGQTYGLGLALGWDVCILLKVFR